MVRREEKGYFEDEWAGLEIGTGREEQGTQGVATRLSWTGSRGRLFFRLIEAVYVSFFHCILLRFSTNRIQIDTTDCFGALLVSPASTAPVRLLQ